MSQVIQAIYEDGVLKPLEKVVLGERQKVQITIEPRPPEAFRASRSRSIPLKGSAPPPESAIWPRIFDEYRLGSKKK